MKKLFLSLSLLLGLAAAPIAAVFDWAPSYGEPGTYEGDNILTLPGSLDTWYEFVFFQDVFFLWDSSAVDPVTGEPAEIYVVWAGGSLVNVTNNPSTGNWELTFFSYAGEQAEAIGQHLYESGQTPIQVHLFAPLGGLYQLYGAQWTRMFSLYDLCDRTYLPENE